MFSSETILPPNTSCSQFGPEKRYGAGFIKKLQLKACFLGWTKVRSGTLLPPIAHLVRLAKKRGGVRFSTKIQTEKVFFRKTNSKGHLRQNWAKFSFGTILPPNAPYSQLGPEKRYWAGFIKSHKGEVTTKGKTTTFPTTFIWG